MDINYKNRFEGESFEYCFNNDTQLGWIKIKSDRECYVFETKRKYQRSFVPVKLYTGPKLNAQNSFASIRIFFITVMKIFLGIGKIRFLYK